MAIVLSGMDGRTYDMQNDAACVFDIENGNFSLLKIIPLSSEPSTIKMAFTSDGSYAYLVASSQWNSNPSRLIEIDLNSLAVSRSIDLSTQLAGSIALANNRLYVSDAGNSMIWIYDRETLSAVDNWHCSDAPGTLAVPPVGSGLYVLFPNALNGGSLSVLDSSTGYEIGGYSGLGCPGAKDIEFSGDGVRVYILTDQYSVIVLKNVDEDNDGDGVPNLDDLCPETAIGADVNDDGCSGEQLVDVDCPCDTEPAWKNHGEYVSCVAHAAEEQLEAGLITQADKDAIVSARAKSGCGKKR